MAAKNPNEEFASWSVLQTVQLQAVATWMLQDLLAQLETLKKEIRDTINSIDSTATLSPSRQKARLQILFDEVEKKIQDIYDEINSRSEKHLEDLAAILALQNKNAVQSIFDESPKGKTDLTGITEVSVLGATLAAWLATQAKGLLFKFQQQINLGATAGDDASSLIKRVIGFVGNTGTADEKIIMSEPGIFKAAQTNLESIIRTGVQAIGNEVGLQVAKQIPMSVGIGYQQISILDLRTTAICRAYAFKTWDAKFNPIGHGLPFDGGCPRHWNCRSRILPIILDSADAQTMTFSNWLQNLSVSTQDKIFGATSMKLFRAGKISEQQLIRQQERILSMDDFKNAPDPRIIQD